MIPYFSFVSFKLGPLNIYVWGLMVAVGFLSGFVTAFFVAKKWNLDFNKIFNLSIFLLIFGLLGARVFWWLEHLGEVHSFVDFINIRTGGLSSLGGFVFAAVILIIYFVRFRKPRWVYLFDFVNPAGFTKSNKLKSNKSETEQTKPNKEVFWSYLDILAIGFIPVWFFSRLGCFFIHDHVGRLSNFFLTVHFPGGARHDLALYEVILMMAIGILFLFKIWSSARKRAQIPPTPPFVKGEKEGDFMNRSNCPRDGFYALILILTYSFFRFFLDFLRATDLPISDPRYFGLTLAQYGMAALFIISLTIWRKGVKVKYSKEVFKNKP